MANNMGTRACAAACILLQLIARNSLDVEKSCKFLPFCKVLDLQPVRVTLPRGVEHDAVKRGHNIWGLDMIGKCLAHAPQVAQVPQPRPDMQSQAESLARAEE